MKIAANISTLFRECPLIERFEAARTAGFDGVEIQLPYSEPASALARARRASGMPVALINGPASPGYPWGAACRAEMQEAFRGQLPQALDYALALDVPRVHLMAGPCLAPDERERCLDVYVENLTFAAGLLGRHGIGVTIEPLNFRDVPDYFLQSLTQAQAVIERCDQRVGLQFDAYHVARMELDPALEFKRVAALVRHVQFADAPGRHEPGTGCIEFESLVAALEQSGYAGWVSAEYFPSATTAAGLGWLTNWRAH